MEEMNNDAGHAEEITKGPLTWFSLSDEAKAALKPLLASMLREGVLFLGRARAGKTTVATILGLMFSRYHQTRADPEFDVNYLRAFCNSPREVSHLQRLGFLKGRPWCQELPVRPG